MRLPKRIDPCPIAEAIVEIRFDSQIEPDAIFGIVYKAFSQKYAKIDKLPILEIPESIRSNDPDFKYKPYYKMMNEGFILQVGPDVISLSNHKSYVGWELFSEKIKEAFTETENLSIVKKVNRLGIRYINFFETIDIFENINLKINMNNDPLKSKQTFIRTQIASEKFINTLQIANKANISTSNGIRIGSIIDIDTFISKENENFFNKMDGLLEEGHLEEKKLFFSLLSPEFLNKYNPEYEKE
jgi:uncharacterized protein (TIGR04255 family)